MKYTDAYAQHTYLHVFRIALYVMLFFDSHSIAC
jgi:hypothetical protein